MDAAYAGGATIGTEAAKTLSRINTLTRVNISTARANEGRTKLRREGLLAICSGCPNLVDLNIGAN